MTTVSTSEELVVLFQQGLLVREFARSFSLKEREQIREIETRCTDLHNAGVIDLLQPIEAGAFHELAASDFFTAMHSYCRILPELKTIPSQMMVCIESLVTLGGQDLASNQPNAAFRTWCFNNPHLAKEVISAALNGDKLASRHLTFALEAIRGIAEARKIALEYDDERRVSAITAISRIKDDDQISRSETLAVFSAILYSAPFDDILHANILGAIATILSQSPEKHSADALALMTQLLKEPGEVTVHASAQILYENAKILHPDIVTSLLNALVNLKPTNKGTVSELDLGLQSLLDHGHGDAAIEYVTNYLSREDNTLQLEELPTFTSALLQGPAERVSRVVVHWLLTGVRSLCDGLASAIQGRGMDGLPLDLRADDLAAIPPSDQIFICRKAIGWFFIKPTTAASVLISVLRVCDEETALEVQDLLVQNLLLNYDGVRKYLESIAEDDPVKGRIVKCLAEDEAHFLAIRSVPLIKELQPSERNRRIERLRIADQMRDVHKQARSQSQLLSIIKRSVILYGNRSISFRKHGDGQLIPMEMDLKPHGISFEMPRMEIVDPIGLDFTLRVFRNEKRVS